MSLLSDLGTKIGTKLKGFDDRIFTLENAPTSSSLDSGGTIDGELVINATSKLGGTSGVHIGYYDDTFSYSNIMTNNHGDVTIGSNLKVDGNHDLVTVNAHSSMTGGAIVIGGNGHDNGTNSINFYSKTSGSVNPGTVYAAESAEVVIRDGKLGIGTTTPDYNLQVESSSTVKVGVTSTTSNGYPTVRLNNPNQSYEMQLNGDTRSFRLYDNTQNAERLTLTTAGNVGIGETTPLGKLHIKDGDSIFENGDLYISSSVGAEGGENGGGTGRPTINFGESEGTSVKSVAMSIVYDGDTYSNEQNRLMITGDGITNTPFLTVYQTTGNVDVKGIITSNGSQVATANDLLEMSSPAAGFNGYFDTRDTQNVPQDYARGLRLDFNRNTIDGLSDGGTYHLTASFRNWSGSSDWSGGGVRQLAFTDNHNMFLRGANADNNWSSWKRVWDSSSLDPIADSITAVPSGDLSLAANEYVNNFRALTSYGSGLTLSSDRITVVKSGVYQIVQSFLFNTGNRGTNGDTRIQINGTDYVAGYSFAGDSATWEKSVASLVVKLNAGDYIRVKMQSEQYLWGSSSGYSHSTLTVARIGQ